MQHEITTLKDVETFIQQVAAEIENFHPLEDFTDYSLKDTYARRYTDEEAQYRNECLEQCFVVCARFTPDYFTYLLNLFQLIQLGARIRRGKRPQDIALKALQTFI